MNKVKAFTLTELIVVMIISTILISLAFTALSMVKRQIGHIQKRTEIKNELISLEKVLHKDFNWYGLGEFNTNRLKFKNPIDSVKYTFEDNFLLRNKDTIKIAVSNLAVYLDGNTVKKGKIDALKFETTDLNNRATFIYTVKDAAFYLNN
ncbi:type II secretion system protein [Tenacibaculum sp. 190524A05c]|uniref:type II secretion system protein n=1 Tax=Tenacibaculum platacis TaxID=3137852 RepID=UPI0031FA6946